MIQCRRRTRLEKEPIKRVLIARQLRRQELQRYLAPQGKILGFVDHTHAATA